MEKADIIAELAEQRVLDTIVYNIGGNADEDLQDLIQDLYIDLMGKPDELIESLYESNQLKFFITKMALNNIRSKNSPYYTNYKKDKTRRLPITDNDIPDDED